LLQRLAENGGCSGSLPRPLLSPTSPAPFPLSHILPGLFFAPREKEGGGFSGRTRWSLARKGASWKGRLFWGSGCCCSRLTTTSTKLRPPAKYQAPSCLPPIKHHQGSKVLFISTDLFFCKRKNSGLYRKRRVGMLYDSRSNESTSVVEFIG
jgi:hypothetical protein